MDLKTCMNELESMGTAQNRKVYKRHGAVEPLFGVSFANLKILQKKIKIDMDLARQLWKTGNSDARTLAFMISDPEQFTEKEAESWMNDISYYGLSNMLGGLIAKTSFADKKMNKWMDSKKELEKHCGYDILATRLRDDSDSISDADCKKILTKIEKEIHDSPNRARNAMNTALIAMGGWKESLTDAAIAAAKRIGKVEVDHGDTSCKTPDAIPYIKKMIARKKQKA